MELQTLLEDYLALLKRENERLHADVATLREQATMTDGERGRNEEDIIKRNTLLWRLAIWDPEQGVSKIHQSFRQMIESGASYDDIEGVVNSVYHNLCLYPTPASKEEDSE